MYVDLSYSLGWYVNRFILWLGCSIYKFAWSASLDTYFSDISFCHCFFVIISTSPWVIWMDDGLLLFCFLAFIRPYWCVFMYGKQFVNCSFGMVYFVSFWGHLVLLSFPRISFPFSHCLNNIFFLLLTKKETKEVWCSRAPYCYCGVMQPNLPLKF